MFEDLMTGAEALASADDAALVTAITDWTRAEAAAAAHRMAAVAEFTDRRSRIELADGRAYWACDPWDSAAAEVAAAQTISHRTASTQMHQALALRDRLPRIRALLADGTISARLAATIAWRTQLVEDPQALALIDADLAAAATTFGPMSATKVETKVDALIEEHDPAAVRRFHSAARGRHIGFGDRDDETGLTSMWGKLYATDAELLERRLDAMTRAVCPDDPRTLGERRSEAMGVLAAGGQVLACTCARPDCPTKSPDARGDAIVVHVHTDQPPTDPDDPGEGGNPNDPPPGDPDEPTAPTDGPAEPTDPPPACPAPGFIAGGGVLPAPLMTELRRMGATLHTVAHPVSYTHLTLPTTPYV